MERCWCGARERRGEDGARSFVGGGGLSASERTGLIMLLLLWAVHVAGVSRGIMWHSMLPWRTWELNDCFFFYARRITFRDVNCLCFIVRNLSLMQRCWEKHLKSCVVPQPDCLLVLGTFQLTRTEKNSMTSLGDHLKPLKIYKSNHVCFIPAGLRVILK